MFLRDVFLLCWNEQRGPFCQLWWQFEQKQRLTKSLETNEVLFESELQSLAGGTEHDTDKL